jgi:hypothetical protein
MSDPRGPLRTATAVELKDGVPFVTLDCGHVRQFASHFSYRVGDTHNCFACVKRLPYEKPAIVETREAPSGGFLPKPGFHRCATIKQKNAKLSLTLRCVRPGGHTEECRYADVLCVKQGFHSIDQRCSQCRR